MALERVLTDIPDSDIDQLVIDFENDGCSATKMRQDDTLWALKAICPEHKYLF